MIFIRADANEIIGTGHVMRCLSIAYAFSDMGEEIIFLTADHKADGLIGNFRSVCLDTDFADMESELPVLMKLVEIFRPRLLVVDSYDVTNNYFSVLNRKVQVSYIDDLCSEHYEVDFLINYNIFAKEDFYTPYLKEHQKLLLKPRYAPLRREFWNVPNKTIKKNVANVFVSAGGSDPEGITEKIITGICPSIKNVTFHIIVGLLNPRLKRIKDLAGKNIVLHINERHMSDLMQKCDMAIAAAGSTLYELCACGIPTIVYTLADNQVIAADTFEKENIMVSAGDCRNNNDFLCILKSMVCQLMFDYDKRMKFSREMQKLVDGKGAERIAEELLKWS